MGETYDVVIVGGRIAGAATALRLVRDGLRVAVVEASEPGDDTLSTHFLWPRAMTYLRRLGLAASLEVGDQVRSRVNFSLEGIAIAARIPARQTQDRMRAVHGDGRVAASESYACIRRQILDRTLIEAAQAAGAELFSRTRVTDITMDASGRVESLACLGGSGRARRLHAPVYVAADGRSSSVARLMRAPFVDRREVSTASCWSYFSGLPAQDVQLAKTGRAGLGVATTNDGLTMILVWGAAAEAGRYLRADEARFVELVAAVSPAFADILRQHGRREERFHRAAGLASFKRRGASGNVLFAGDAACFKDQCTASGILHALRDAELASEEILAGYAGERSWDDALARYAARREADAGAYFEYACQAAAMAPATAQEIAFVRACRVEPELAASFLSVAGDSLASLNLPSGAEHDPESRTVPRQDYL